MKKTVVMLSVLIIGLLMVGACSKGTLILEEPPLNITWSQITQTVEFDSRAGHTSLVYGDKMWIITGNGWDEDDDVLNSSDGGTWIQVTNTVTFGQRESHTSIVFNDLMWVIGGTSGSGDVWKSNDGIVWEQVTNTAGFGEREGHTSIVYNSKIWVIGGWGNSKRHNDVWCSGDGIDWIQTTETAAFGEREGHASVVFKNMMWVIGGFGKDGNCYNDVWNSSDGINWNQVTGEAGFKPRYGHTCIVYKDKMWIIGGEHYYYNSMMDEGYYFLDDVWYSKNGAKWIKVAGTTGFNVRAFHTSVVYNNAIWIIGGYNGLGYYNDVWQIKTDN